MEQELPSFHSGPVPGLVAEPFLAEKQFVALVQTQGAQFQKGRALFAPVLAVFLPLAELPVPLLAEPQAPQREGWWILH